MVEGERFRRTSRWDEFRCNKEGEKVPGSRTGSLNSESVGLLQRLSVGVLLPASYQVLTVYVLVLLFVLEKIADAFCHVSFLRNRIKYRKASLKKIKAFADVAQLVEQLIRNQ